MTFNELINEYLLYLKFKNKPTTILWKERKLRLYVSKFFGNMKVKSFTNKNYISWINYIFSLNYSDSFNKRIQSVMIDLFRYALLFYNIDNIPLKFGTLKDFSYKKHIQHDTWSLNEYNCFISAAKNDIVYFTLFETLFYTGMRKGELLALTWEDINFTDKTIHVNKTITKEFFNGKRLVLTPKSKKSDRIICVDDKLLNELLDLKKFYMKLYKNFNYKTFVFGYNKAIATTTLDRKKEKYEKISNVRHIRIHDIRHSHANLLYYNGVDIKTIQHRLGHADISTTLNIYVHDDENEYLKVNYLLNSIH